MIILAVASVTFSCPNRDTWLAGLEMTFKRLMASTVCEGRAVKEAMNLASVKM